MPAKTEVNALPTIADYLRVLGPVEEIEPSLWQTRCRWCGKPMTIDNRPLDDGRVREQPALRCTNHCQKEVHSFVKLLVSDEPTPSAPPLRLEATTPPLPPIVHHVHIGHEDNAASWGPLPDLNARPLPAFPLDALPNWLRLLATGLGRFVQVPPESVAVLALGVLAAAVRGAVVVRVKPGYEELVVLYVLIAMSSGSRKGPLYDALAKPLYDWEAAARERMRPVRIAKQAEKKRLEAELKKAERSGNAETISQAASALATCEVPPDPRLICADITLEKLASIMHEQGGTMNVFSPEAVLFGIIGGRYNDGAPNIDLLLMAYSGEPVTVDRIGREGVNLRHAKLTIALTVQPSVLQDFVAHPVYRQRGLVARFLFCLPPSLVAAS